MALEEVKLGVMSVQHLYFSSAGTGNAYTDLTIVDNRFLYFSGLIAQDLDTQTELCGSITEETRTILNNLKALLARYGSDMEHVIRADVLLANFADRDEMNAEYIRHFNGSFLPARLCYGNVALHGKCKIEIAVIAERVGV